MNSFERATRRRSRAYRRSPRERKTDRPAPRARTGTPQAGEVRHPARGRGTRPRPRRERPALERRDFSNAPPTRAARITVARAPIARIPQHTRALPSRPSAGPTARPLRPMLTPPHPPREQGVTTAEAERTTPPRARARRRRRRRRPPAPAEGRVDDARGARTTPPPRPPPPPAARPRPARARGGERARRQTRARSPLRHPVTRRARERPRRGEGERGGGGRRAARRARSESCAGTLYEKTTERSPGFGRVPGRAGGDWMDSIVGHRSGETRSIAIARSRSAARASLGGAGRRTGACLKNSALFRYLAEKRPRIGVSSEVCERR